MLIMPAQRKYPQELRDRAVRLVQEATAQDADLSSNQAVIRAGQRVGVNADTLRGRTRQVAIDLAMSCELTCAVRDTRLQPDRVTF